jgi:uncharacterized membrane protein
MTSLAITIVVYALSLAFWLTGNVILRRTATDTQKAALWVLQAGLMVQAIADTIEVILSRRRPSDLATHCSYLVASLILLPLFAMMQRDKGAHRDVAAGVSCAAVAVVTVRLQMTAGIPHA